MQTYPVRDMLPNEDKNSHHRQFWLEFILICSVDTRLPCSHYFMDWIHTSTGYSSVLVGGQNLPVFAMQLKACQEDRNNHYTEAVKRIHTMQLHAVQLTGNSSQLILERHYLLVFITCTKSLEADTRNFQKQQRGHALALFLIFY